MSNNTCLNLNLSAEVRYLVYPDSSLHPVVIPYPPWTSAQVLAQIVFIILVEVMNYAAELYPRNTNNDWDFVNFAAGCSDPNDNVCPNADLKGPIVHFTLETWDGGAQRDLSLETAIRPRLLSIEGYYGIDTYFLWQDVVDRSLNSPTQPSLDFYRSYDATLYNAHLYFDPWQKMVSFFPSSVIINCSEMSEDGVPFLSHYIHVTNDTQDGCGYNDTLWFSPSCRANRTKCVPIMVQYSFEMIMQLAYFLNLPLAILKAGPGNDGAYADYYHAARSGRFLFGYWQPDDTLVDSRGRLPVQLILPLANDLEQQEGVYRTGDAQQTLRNYAWRDLEQVAARAAVLSTGSTRRSAHHVSLTCMRNVRSIRASPSSPPPSASSRRTWPP